MQKIYLTNSKTRKKELFTPIDSKNLRMYVCGPTVYDRAHLGNARPVVVFDILYRILRHIYGANAVRYVRNFTDIDDKINARAAQLGVDIGHITRETTQWFLDDMHTLGALEPTDMPRATAYVPQMIDMIARLIEKGHAYAAEGHVLFNVDSYAKYGAFSGRSTDDMIAGARIEVAPYKSNPMDFVLWKPSDEATPGWQSPWGFGRPGWHIECSAMSYDLLGAHFDIHGGGNDLMFPHHENEIAQSCCAHSEAGFANVWLHNEMLQVEGKKMSKSLGNFFTVYDLLAQGYPGEVIRFVLLMTQYSKPMDWTAHKAQEARKTLQKWHEKTHGVAPADAIDPQMLDFICDDLNTAGALARMHQLFKAGEYAALKTAAQFMGLCTGAQNWWQQAQEDVTQAQIEALLKARQVAKAQKDFTKADAIRAGLLAAGVEIQDSADGANAKLTAQFDAAKLPALE